jgi:hypothetical protein
VPLAGALQVILAHALRVEDPSQAEEHPDPGERALQQGAPSASVTSSAAPSTLP